MATAPDPRDRKRGVLSGPARHLQSSLTKAGPAAAASYTLIGGIIVLGGLGYLADGWLGTEPWLLLGGLLLGIVVGFYEIARVTWRSH